MPDVNPNAANASITPAPVLIPDSPEYNAAMIAKAQGNVSITTPEGTQPIVAPVKETAATIPTRPDNIPEKFWNAEKGIVDVDAMAKSYTEIEKKISAPKTEVKPTPAATVTPEQQAAAEADAAAKAAASPVVADLVTKAGAEYVEKGAFSEETLVALEKSGISRATVQNYTEGLQARAELVTMKVYSEAGSKEQYGAMASWAAANLAAEQVASLNATLLGGDIGATLGAVKTLKALYTAANGSDATGRIEGDRPGTAASGEHFKSAAEQTAAMQDPRYKIDPAYRDAVAQKIANAYRLKMNLGVYGVG